ncbi:hypothetical protein [Haloquadratum walsbyi]|uniref:hypothetical protein n=1 Tax=Haloquadratum walsbyi TaxID=293091 RepID=UPI000323B89D|nr:hypothetical protein [Haloquadratum walsbyi]
MFDDIAARNVFSDEDIASRIEAFRSEYSSRFYYDIDRPVEIALPAFTPQREVVDAKRIVEAGSPGA